MKPKIMLALVVTAIALYFSGCSTANPDYKPASPVSAMNQPYIPDTNALAKLNGTIQKAETINDATAPLDPYAPMIKMGLEGTSAIALLLSGLVASLRSKLAAHRKAGQTLANVVAGAGGNLVALANAPDSRTAAIIAEHLQDSPLPNQAPPKT